MRISSTAVEDFVFAHIYTIRNEIFFVLHKIKQTENSKQTYFSTNDNNIFDKSFTCRVRKAQHMFHFD